jgi:hypothetical protein
MAKTKTPKPPEPPEAPEAAPAPPPPEKHASPLVEDLFAPEVFAIEAQSISLVQGMISIAFSSARYDNSETPSGMKRVVVSRLVIPPAGALNMAVRLFALLDKHGLGAAPKNPTQRQ